MSSKLHVVLAGNPGVGKSTLLSAFCGVSSVFNSGPSLATGLTTVSKKYETPQCIWCDTPGLCDITSKTKAAQEIKDLLSIVGNMKIIFVVTLDSGRVKPEDAATIDLILSAIVGVDLHNNFGIIVNKVSDSVKQEIDKKGLDTILSALFIRYKTCHVAINEFDLDLLDATNIVKSPSQTVVDLIKSIPAIRVKTVAEIHADEVARMRAEQEAKEKQLREEQERKHREEQERIQREIQWVRDHPPPPPPRPRSPPCVIS